MKDNTSDLLPQGIRDAIGKAAEYNKSTVLHDHKSHPQLMREGMFKAAANYAGSYKQQHPEAVGLMTRIETLAYKPKPSGYPQFIDGLVDSWLSGTADSETNTATVQRIRDRFPNHSFAGNLLNKPLSKFMLAKVAALATDRGLALNSREHDTLAKIKAAARKGELAAVADRHIIIRAMVTDTHLAGLKIEHHRKRQSIRFTHVGKRIRMYIDDLIALSELLAEDAGDSTFLSTLKSIGILAPKGGKPSETRQGATEIDALCFDAGLNGETISGILAPETRKPAETLDNDRECLAGNIGPSQPEPTLTERIAALRANIPADDAPAYPPDYDPLCNL